jgi:hypothetical protein
MLGDLPADEPELQITVIHGDRVGVVSVVRLAPQIHLGADAKTADRILSSFEGHTNDFRMKLRRAADRCISIVDIFLRVRKCSLDERINAVILSLSKGTVTAFAQEGGEGDFKCGFRRRGPLNRNATLGARRPGRAPVERRTRRDSI